MACLATVIHLELRTVGAGVEHLHEGFVFRLGSGEIPSGFDRDPVDGVLAPVRSVFWSAGSVGAVGAGGDGDEVLGIVQIYCEAFAFCG